MAIDFPTSPAAGDTYTYNGRSWRYNAQGGWERVGGGLAASDDASGVLEIADKAELEAAADLLKAVTPGRMQYHPGVAKAWVNFNGTGTVAIRVSLNVSSITDHGTAVYTVNFTTAFSSANYSAAGISITASVAEQFISGPNTSAPTSTTWRFTTFTSAGAQVDPDYCHLVFHGDQ
jgi:hypothetical protein